VKSRKRGFPDESLASSIDDFLEELIDLHLSVTTQAASKLVELRKRLDSMPENANVDKTLAAEVTQEIDALDRTLDSELMLRNAYVVTPKRFDIGHLLNAPSSLLGQGVYQRLRGVAQFDFTEACRCIAFARPTAAAFHLMRAVEETLRQYYCSIVKRGRVEPLLWGPMIEHLTKRRDSPPRALLDSLTNIRVNFRNPTQHPEARYDMDAAQDLMMISVETLNRLSQGRRDDAA